MKIGIDFGTTYTKISYLDLDGKIQLFSYPAPPTGQTFIPSAMAYCQGDPIPLLGAAARMALAGQKRSKVSFHETFKMLLPTLDPREWEQAGWSGKHTPQKVTRDFFRLLLLDADCSFKRGDRTIERMVVSVPEVWQRTKKNAGAGALRKIIGEELGMPLAFLKSEPVCAAAYYAHRTHQLNAETAPYNLLVCDVGGGTFDVALCRVENQRVSVLYFDGNGLSGLGQAGSLFDHQAIQIAYEAVEHKPLNPDHEQYARLLQEFEQVKMASHDEAARLIERFHAKSEMGDTVLYTFHAGDYELTLDQVKQAFEPVREGIETVLARVQAQARQLNQPVERLILIGGFARFPLVEAAIKKALAGQPSLQIDASLNSDERFYAVSYGAALIANDKILPVEYYPHTLGVKGYSTADFKEQFFPIAEAGKMPIGQSVPYWACTSGQLPISIRVEKKEGADLPVFFRQLGKGKEEVIAVDKSFYPTPGIYQIGLMVDESGLGTLIFEPQQAGAKTLIPLSHVI